MSRISILSPRALLLLAGVSAVMILLAAATGGAQQAPERAPLGPPVSVSGETENGGTFDGVIRGGQVTVQDGEAVLSGVLQGTVTNPDGSTERVSQQFSGVPLAVFNGGDAESCQILFLDVGPIFLDLLGLQVDLSPIQLDVTAVPGPGNLLGNLLCGLVGILD
jgi:hypothetical protein